MGVYENIINSKKKKDEEESLYERITGEKTSAKEKYEEQKKVLTKAQKEYSTALNKEYKNTGAFDFTLPTKIQQNEFLNKILPSSKTTQSTHSPFDTKQTLEKIKIAQNNVKDLKTTVDEEYNKLKYAKALKNAEKVENEKTNLWDKTGGVITRALTDVVSSIGMDKYTYIDEDGNKIYLPTYNDLKQQKVSQDYDTKIGKYLGDFAYTTSKILGTSAINTLAPGVGTFTYYQDMFMDNYKSTVNQGYDSVRSSAYALTSTGLEFITGKFLGSATKKLTGGTSNAYSNALSNAAMRLTNNPTISRILGDAGSEATEEFLQEYLDNINRLVTLENTTNIDDYVSIFTDSKILEDALYSAAVGALSGGFIAGTDVSGNKNTNQNIQMFKEFKTQLEDAKKTTTDVAKVEQYDNAINKINEYLKKPFTNNEIKLPTINQEISMHQNISNINTINKTTEGLDLIESSKVYNIDSTSETINSINNLLNKRNINGRFDSTLFNDTSTNAFWSIDSNSNRSVIFNPNAKTNDLLQNVAIHELTHDLLSSKNSAEILNLKDILDFISTKEGYIEARNNLIKDYSKVYDPNSAEFQKIIDEEVVASVLGNKLGTQEFVNQLVYEKPSMAKRILNWIENRINDLKKLVGYTSEKTYWTDVKNRFEKAYKMSYNNANKQADVRMSIYSGNAKYKNKKLDSIVFAKAVNTGETNFSVRDANNYYIIDNAIDGNYDVFKVYSIEGNEEFLNNIDKLRGEYNANRNRTSNSENTTGIEDRLGFNSGNNVDVEGQQSWTKFIDSVLETVRKEESDNKRFSIESRKNNRELENSSFSFKQKQLDIILKNNPVEDDYHTWIRSIDDIKTLGEALNDSDWADYDEYNPDLTKQDIEEAINSGKIIVYSSYPIEQGIFVSPSKIEAESYSSDGKIYSKEVNVNDVAWIDPTQGQYAKVPNEYVRYSQENNLWNNFVNKNFKSEGTGKTLQEVKLPTAKNKIPTYKDFEVKEIPKNPTKESTYDDFKEEKKTAQLLEKRPIMEKTSVKDNYHTFIREIVDKGEAINRLAKKTGNKELYAKYDHMGTAEAEGNYAIAIAQTDNKGNKIGKSVVEIWKPVEDAGLVEEFSNYLLHKHNIARWQQGKPVFGEEVTSDISKKFVEESEKKYPQFTEWSKDINTYNKNQMQNMVDAGLTSKESQEYLNNTYDNYVRIYRDVRGNGPITQFRGNLKVNVPIKKAKGGNQDILPLKDSMAQQTIETKKAIRRNEFGLELLNVLNNGENVEYDGKQQVVKNDDGTYSFTVFKDGQPIKMEIDEGIYEAIKPTEIKNPKLLAPIRGLSKIQRGLLTDKNPLFIATNFFKDIGDAPFNSKYGSKFAKNYIIAAKEIMNNSELWNRYRALGGEQNTYFDYESGVKVPSNSKVSKFIRKIQSINQVVEQLPRFTEFISTLEAGGTEAQAMYNAAEVTTNFKRGGDVAKALNRNGANFLNASIQGFDKQIRNFTGQNGVKGYVNLLAKATILGILPSVLNHLLLDDDEDYQELPDYIKDSYFLFKTGDGKFIRIPKGRVVSTFGMTARRTLEYADGEKDAFDGLLNQISNQVAPNNPLEDNVFAPFLAIKNNRSWNGSEIVPQRLQNELSENQYDEKTDAISKFIGKTFKVSPKKVNYLLDQYTGGIGDVILPMLSPEANQNPISAKFTTDSVMNNKYVSEFYDTKDKLTKQSNSLKATDEDILKTKYINSMGSEMNNLYKEKREIQNSNLSNKEKLLKVKEVQQKINDIAKFSLEDYENVYIDGNYGTVGELDFYKGTNGEWTKATNDLIEKQNNISAKYDITASEFYNNREEYTYAYNNPEKYAVISKITSFDKYNAYKNKITDIMANTTNDKTETIKYINSLNLSIPQKAMFIKMYYPSFDNYNTQIVNYVKQSTKTVEERTIILNKLGFTIKNGRVY